ncbi:acyltransferase family protein [Leucobacter sp. GX24907]
MSQPAAVSPPRFGGLDGLRAIAVALVLVYHLFPGALPGGFLGVDVFFVISGFLISSLLLSEHRTTGRVRLGRFWQRRARRLLPALALVLVVCTSLALLVDRDVLVGIGSQVAGAAFFVSNWIFIANGADYFAQDNPELFRNTWSLSIEEQFYILLPLLLLALIKSNPRFFQALPFLLLAIASSLWMTQLSISGAEPTRIYFGSDTHTFGLLLGVVLAIMLHPHERNAQPGITAQTGYTVAALLGLAALGWFSATMREGSPFSFEGGFQLATLAAVLVVWAVTRPGAWIGRALDIAPLRWIGERSYGIYLWHWPLLVLVAAAPVPWAALPQGRAITGAVVLLATLLIAALSYRYVEQPVRRFGLRRSLALLVRPVSQTPRMRVVAASLGLVLIASVPTAAYAVASAPAQSSAADAIARGQAMLDEDASPGDRRDEEAGDSGAEDSGSAGSGTDGTGAHTDRPGTDAGDAQQAEQGAKAALETPENVVIDGSDITAIGDSVMLASLPELDSAFPGISVDAEVSRGLVAGVGITDAAAAQGQLRSVLVVGLGTNGPIDAAGLDELRRIAGTRPIVLVNAHADRDWIPGVNKTLSDYAASHRGVVVADWSGSVTPEPDALAGDGIHPNPSGGEIYANSVQTALEDLEDPQEALGLHAPRY